MRNIVLPFLILMSGPCGFLKAQELTSPHAIGIHQEIHDINVHLLQGKWSSFDTALSQTLRLSYFKDLNSAWTFNTGLTGGFLHGQQRQENAVRKTWSTGFNMAIQWRANNGWLLRETSTIAPFLAFGYQIDHLPGFKELGFSPWVFRNNYGTGLNIRVGKRSIVQIQAAIAQELGGDYQTHLTYSLGFIQKIGTRHVFPFDLSYGFEDLDGDGLADRIDECPDVAGMPQYFGCPGPTPEDSSAVWTESAVNEPDERDTTSDSDTMVVTTENDIQTERVPEKDSITLPIQPFPSSKDRDSIKIASEPRDTLIADSGIAEQKTWYVIIFSASNEAAARSVEMKAKRNFSKVMLLPQPNGYIRVAVPSGMDKHEAEILMYAIRQQGYPKAWLWRQ